MKTQEAWVVHPAVMAALHVPSDAVFVSADNGVGMQYDLTEKNLMPFYRDVAQNHPELRVLVYNGDTPASTLSCRRTGQSLWASRYS